MCLLHLVLILSEIVQLLYMYEVETSTATLIFVYMYQGPFLPGGEIGSRLRTAFSPAIINFLVVEIALGPRNSRNGTDAVFVFVSLGRERAYVIELSRPRLSNQL